MPAERAAVRPSAGRPAAAETPIGRRRAAADPAAQLAGVPEATLGPQPAAAGASAADRARPARAAEQHGAGLDAVLRHEHLGPTAIWA